MKKVFTLVLTVVLALAMAVPAFAVGSPTAPVAAPDKTAALPVVVESTMECSFFSIFDADKLSEENWEEFIAGQKCLKDVIPEGMTAKFFFYHMHVDDAAHDGLCQHTFDIGEFEEVIVKQYIEEEWVELEELGKKLEEEKTVAVNSDGTITVTGLETGPVAFFTK